MSRFFKLGDRVRCISKTEDNWYKIGDEFVIQSSAFIDQLNGPWCYLIGEEGYTTAYIQGEHFELVEGSK